MHLPCPGRIFAIATLNGWVHNKPAHVSAVGCLQRRRLEDAAGIRVVHVSVSSATVEGAAAKLLQELLAWRSVGGCDTATHASTEHLL
jgi:hypothetical protein